jgi:hypothetical protein
MGVLSAIKAKNSVVTEEDPEVEVMVRMELSI